VRPNEGEPTVRATTYGGYDRTARLYIVPRLGAVPLQQLTPDQVTVMYRNLLETGGRGGGPLSPATVRRAHSTLHRALKDATLWGYVMRNMASVAVKPKTPSPGSAQMKTWSAAEVRQFLDSVAGDRLFAAWRLAASTGMRRGEIIGLRWSDVDLESGQLAVRQTITTRDSTVVFGEPKTARSRRIVALDTETVVALRSWRTRQLEERLLWGEAWNDTGCSAALRCALSSSCGSQAGCFA